MENLIDDRNSEQIKIADQEKNQSLKHMSTFIEDDWFYKYLSPIKESEPKYEEENLIAETPPKMDSGDSNSNFIPMSLGNTNSSSQ